MSRKYDLSNPNDLAEIMRLLEDDAAEDPASLEDLGDESNIDSQDEVGEG